MREVHPEGIITREAVTAATAEDDVEDAKLLSHSGGPTEENISNDAESLGSEVLDEVLEGFFEGGGSLDELDDEVVGDSVGVLSVRREAVFGAGEREFVEGDGGVRWERGSELVDVEGSVDDYDAVVI